MIDRATALLFADLAGDLTRADVQWMDFALCAEVDGELFFPEVGIVPREARRVCLACPVRPDCLEYALDNRILHGVFGGLSERERRSILARREREVA